jgi:hypothetical protein
MNFIKRIFSSKELKAALGVIDECDVLFSNSSLGGNGFDIIKSELKAYMHKNEKNLIDHIEKGQSPRACVLFAIATMTKNQIISGNYHIYRGVLNNLSGGSSLQSIYNQSLDLLVKEGRLTEEDSKYSKDQLRKAIEEMG